MSGDYAIRSYRSQHRGEDLHYFRLQIKETDLAIGIDRDKYHPDLVRDVEKKVIKLRGDLETYIAWHPEFLSSLEPLAVLPGAPAIVRKMAEAAAKAGVGPMAAVAGAVSWETGQYLASFCENVIVENGGDIYVKTVRERLIGVWAGNSPFSRRVAIKVGPEESPLGVCTSSGTVGPSFSFGRADAAMVKARDSYLADAVASGVGNRVSRPEDLEAALAYAQAIEGVTGVLAIIGDSLAACGNIELVPLQAD